jgi:hypothetical protein
MTGLFMRFGLSTKSLSTFFFVPIFIGIAAVGTGKARALTLVASGAPAAFIRICQLFLRNSWSRRTSSACYFSAAGTSRREA